MTEMAAAERIQRGYLGSLLRLTLLAPDIVEGLLSGRRLNTLGLRELMEAFPTDWASQRGAFESERRPITDGWRPYMPIELRTTQGQRHNLDSHRQRLAVSA